MFETRKNETYQKLHSNHEIVGTLLSVEEDDTCSKLQFSCNKLIELPSTAILHEQLSLLVGERIGIFNYEGNYKIRIIKGKKYV